jgi:hypothetical protein
MCPRSRNQKQEYIILTVFAVLAVFLFIAQFQQVYDSQKDLDYLKRLEEKDHDIRQQELNVKKEALALYRKKNDLC